MSGPVEIHRKPYRRKGRQPYQDAKLAIILRNEIVHFKPEDLSPDEPAAMEQDLKGKFQDNQMMTASGNPWWPNICLGWGCARWSLVSVTALADHLVSATGVEPAYTLFRAKNQLGDVP
jgi:hypothetical protein